MVAYLRMFVRLSWQYNAVQRKVSGTSGGFFGEQVELKGKVR
jgi:hypothetical protein